MAKDEIHVTDGVKGTVHLWNVGKYKVTQNGNT